MSNGNNDPETPKRTWRRVTLSVFGIVIIALHWRWAVNHLYSLPAEKMTAFTSITQSAFYVIGAIVVFLVTGLTFYSWTQSTSIASNIAQQITQMLKPKEEDKK